MIDQIRQSIHPDWEPLFAEQQHTLETLIPLFAEEMLCPEPGRIFRFAERGIGDLKVVILGQDPYPRRAAATGRAFEVGDLLSWQDPFRQVSLKNILRAVYLAYEGNLVSWTELRGKIAEGTFSPLPPTELFASWEAQGVLLLNTSLTCLEGKPGAHRRYWSAFSKAMISYLDTHAPKLRWFLWGADAIRAADEVKGARYASRHPMLSGGPWEDDFFRNPCFVQTKGEIDWRGVSR